MSTPLAVARSGFLAALLAFGLGLGLGLTALHAADTAPATTPAATPAANFAEPTRITLHLKDTPLEDAVAALGKAAGVRFTIADSAWDAKGVAKTISLDADALPFWEVLLTLCDKSGLMLAPRGVGTENAQRIQLYPAGQFGTPRNSILQRPHMIHGPFLITADNISRMRNLDADKDARDSVNIQMTAYCQPGTHVGQIGQFVVAEAVDEAGVSLLTDGSRMINQFYFDAAAPSFNISAALQAPPDSGRKIARLKGSLPLIIITKTETLEVPDITTITEPVQKNLGDCTFSVSPAKPGAQKNTWELELVITRDNMMGGRAPGFAVLRSSQLVDKDGNPWRSSTGSGGGSGQKSTYKMTYYQQNQGGPAADAQTVPAKFVMEIPTQTREVTLPIDFQDLPLP